MRNRKFGKSLPTEFLILTTVAVTLSVLGCLYVWTDNRRNVQMHMPIDIAAKLTAILPLAEHTHSNSEDLTTLAKATSHGGLRVSFSTAPAVEADDAKGYLARHIRQEVQALGYASRISIESTPLLNDILTGDVPTSFDSLAGINSSVIAVENMPSDIILPSSDSEMPIDIVEFGLPIEMTDIAFPGFEHVEISIPLRDNTSVWLNLESELISPAPVRIWPYVWIILAGFVIVITSHVAISPSRNALQALYRGFRAFDMRQNTVILDAQGWPEQRDLIQQFNSFVRQSSHSLQEQTEILNAVSHDLLTPLTSLKIRAEFIDDETLKADMTRTIEEMQTMSQAVLEAARGGASQEAVQKLELSSFLEALVEDDHRIGRTTEIQQLAYAVIDGRPSELRRMFRNLIDNAHRYADEVSIEMRIIDQHVDVLICDDGPGIPQDSLETVLKPFKRLDESRNKNTGGFGLGLTIANAIALRHKATLDLRNRRSGGLCASVRFDASDPKSTKH